MSSEQKRREKELAAIRKKLTPGRLEFANLYVSNLKALQEKRILVPDIYSQAFPKQKSTKVASASAGRLLEASNPVKRYIDLMIESQCEKVAKCQIRSIEDTMVDLERMATADILSLCSFRIVEGEDGSKIPIPMMMDPNEVPTEIRRLIKGVTFTKNGPKLELHDQLRAQEMLLKMRGAFTERRQVELTGAGGGAIQIEGEIKVTVETVVKNLLDNL